MKFHKVPAIRLFVNRLMNMKTASIFLCIFFCTIISAQANNDSLIKYTSDFRFNDGVFIDFQSVKHNAPIPKSRLISNYNFSDPEFFENLLSQKKNYYFDNLGNRLELNTDNIWGYANNGFLYIGINNTYNKITIVGSICHVMAYQTYETYTNPYSYDNYSYNYPYNPGQHVTNTEMKQFLFDFINGRIVEYDSEGLEVLLMADPVLYDEYSQLSSKKKNQLKFVYMRKFNDKNPLYLIKNKN